MPPPAPPRRYARQIRLCLGRCRAPSSWTHCVRKRRALLGALLRTVPLQALGTYSIRHSRRRNELLRRDLLRGLPRPIQVARACTRPCDVHITHYLGMLPHCRCQRRFGRSICRSPGSCRFETPGCPVIPRCLAFRRPTLSYARPAGNCGREGLSWLGRRWRPWGLPTQNSSYKPAGRLLSRPPFYRLRPLTATLKTGLRQKKQKQQPPAGPTGKHPRQGASRGGSAAHFRPAIAISGPGWGFGSRI